MFLKMNILNQVLRVTVIALNSLPKNELGSWCHERLVGVPHKYKAQKEGFLADSVSEKQPCQWPPTSTVTSVSLLHLH